MVFIKGGVSVISLTGFMFSGKTSAGRVLAKETGFAFYDIDNLIEEKCSMSVSGIFEKYGEAYFREAERAVVKTLFESGLEKSVVALGGGTICDRANFEIINERSLLICLMVPYGEILKRKKELSVSGDTERPLAAEAENGEFAKLFEDRRKIYEKARFNIDCSGLGVEEVAVLIKKIIEMKEIN